MDRLNETCRIIYDQLFERSKPWCFHRRMAYAPNVDSVLGDRRKFDVYSTPSWLLALAFVYPPIYAGTAKLSLFPRYVKDFISIFFLLCHFSC
jgi:hypothetical protein